MPTPFELKQQGHNESYEYYANNIDTSVTLTMHQDGFYRASIGLIQIGHNDALDAFRHAYTSGIFAMEYNSTFSNLLGWANEYSDILATNPKNERVMDLNNNKVGREISETVSNRTELAQALETLLSNGGLITDPASSPSNYNSDVILFGLGGEQLTIKITDGNYSAYVEASFTSAPGEQTPESIATQISHELGTNGNLLQSNDTISVNFPSSSVVFKFLEGTSASELFNLSGSMHIVDGGDGNDTISYASSGSAVNVDLDAGNTLQSGIIGFKDIFDNIEAVTGSAFDDTILGHFNDANTITGLGGNDELVGAGIPYKNQHIRNISLNAL